MLANGYEPLPLIGKAPIPKRWEQIIINEEMVSGWSNVGPNTGMRTARTPALDVDILDSEGARVVWDTLQSLLDGRGKILSRVGLFPKFAIMFYTDQPFKKIIRKLRAPDGKIHKIEVLADGQQIAVAGIHPDAKEPFRWRGGLSPVNTPRSELPLVDEDEIRAILALITDELKVRLGGLRLTGHPSMMSVTRMLPILRSPNALKRCSTAGNFPSTTRSLPTPASSCATAFRLMT